LLNRALLILGYVLVIYGLSATAVAQVQSSPSYQIDESTIGPGGSVQSSSAHYQESGSVGDTGTGTSSSNSYTQVAGFNTTSDPRLAVILNSSSVAFGSLSSASTAKGTASFIVLNYTTHGYSVYTVGATPSNGSHNLNALGSGGGSTVGTEQYGINLTANTTPIVGTGPVQVPSGSFSFGIASTGYDIANSFRYNNGEKIAESAKASGETDYTISYIVNISTLTPGSTYTGRQSLVVVRTY